MEDGVRIKQNEQLIPGLTKTTLSNSANRKYQNEAVVYLCH